MFMLFPFSHCYEAVSCVQVNVISFEVAHPSSIIKYKVMLQSVNTTTYSVRIRLHVSAKNG